MSPNITNQSDCHTNTLSKEEIKDFQSIFPNLIQDVIQFSKFDDVSENKIWLKELFEYNISHGKCSRGIATALSYKHLSNDLTEENIRLSYVLGWCVEIFQGSCLIADDLVDGSDTRRARPCWYKKDNIGTAALNDTIFLDSARHFLINKYFRNKSYYKTLIHVFRDVIQKTLYGQSLDTLTGMKRNMKLYSMELYSAIVKYKTSYYSFYLPVRLAMVMAGINDKTIIDQVKTVTLEIGHLFQVQDDFLDCFGNVNVTGKIGTDIQDCKCSWLFVTALEKCSLDQLKSLMDNYGQHDLEKVERVKSLYNELGLVDMFKAYEEMTFNKLNTDIQNLPETLLPKFLFTEMVNKIYRRDH